MKHAKKLMLLLPVLALLAGVSACNESANESGPLSTQEARQPGWHAASQQALLPLLNLEKQRIEAEKERRKGESEALALQFDDSRGSPDVGAVAAQGLVSGLLGGTTKLLSELLICRPQDYDADAAVIGPKGGEIRVGDHKLVIPEGALADYTLITMEAPASRNVEVTFTPHGLAFKKEPVLTLSYARCLVPHVLPFGVVYINDNNKIVEWPTSIDVLKLGYVNAWIKHFSRYAVASN